MRVSNSNISGWYLNDASVTTSVATSMAPTYAAQKYPSYSAKL